MQKSLRKIVGRPQMVRLATRYFENLEEINTKKEFYRGFERRKLFSLYRDANKKESFMHVYNRNLPSIREHYATIDESTPYEGNFNPFDDDILHSKRFLKNLASREKNLVLTSKGTNIATFSVQSLRRPRPLPTGDL